MDESPWEILETEALAEHPVKIVHERLRTHTGAVLDYYYQPRPIRVIFALPITAAGTALMIRQYRHPTRRFLLEVPAGKVDAGEALEDAVRRELLEEIGAEVGELVRFPAFYPQPSFNAAVFHPFAALDARRTQEPRLESGEMIETVELPLAEVYGLLESGGIEDASTALTLFYARPWLERLGLL
ncbi:NUDIX hydrolase [Oceanithermus sp.]|uniref:NUDIX hydrolase n=3 Tax=Oceanithermus sp. TaxID=2268145 RepID=UPI0025EC5B0C|nr:NUDIX hydrolase [Oceanithermus sp.]